MSHKLGMIARGNPRSATGRKVAVLAADDVDAAGLQAMRSALLSADAKVRVLSTRLGELRSAGGGTVAVDDLLVATPSIMFDAVLVPCGTDSITALRNSGDAVHFVREALKHAKPVSTLGERVDLLVAAAVLPAATTVSTGLFARPAGVSTAAAGAVAALAPTFLADISVHRQKDRFNIDHMAA